MSSPFEGAPMSNSNPVSNFIDQSKKMPVFWIVSVVLVVIFLAYSTGKLKTLPCGPGPLQAVERNLVHVEFSHIAANLVSFFILSRMEIRNGSKNYAIMILVLLLLCSGTELALNFGKSPKKCSIGFSGVLFGLLAWELVTNQAKLLDFQTIAALVLAVVGTSASNPRASFEGHAIGAACGFAAGLISKLIKKK